MHRVRRAEPSSYSCADDRYADPAMSTRKLIILSLLCGVAILGAFVAQLLIAR